MSSEPGPGGHRRDTYHHGDLHHALVVQGLDLARTGGAGAVILREATRRAGVSPNAAYRHFTNREALLDEVSLEAARKLGAAMTEAADRAREEAADADPRQRGTDVLVAACRAYIDFALSETGWFDVAFAESPEALRRLDESGQGRKGLPSGVIADLVNEEGLPWVTSIDSHDLQVLILSVIHGLSVLITAGPLRNTDRDALAERMLTLIRSSVLGATKG